MNPSNDNPIISTSYGVFKKTYNLSDMRKLYGDNYQLCLADEEDYTFIPKGCPVELRKFGADEPYKCVEHLEEKDLPRVLEAFSLLNKALKEVK